MCCLFDQVFVFSFRLFFIVVVFSFSNYCFGVTEYSLKDLLRLATENSNSIQLAKLQSDSDKESVLINKAALYPKIIASGGFTRLGLPEISRNPSEDKYSHNAKINLSQTIYHGSRESNIITQSKLEASALNDDINSEVMSLYLEVIQKYFTILSAQKDLEILQTERSTLLERIKELRSRVNLGKVRKVELYSAESQHASNDADIVAVSILIEKTKIDLGLLLLGKKIELALKEDKIVIPENLALNDLLKKVESRPDVLSLEKKIQAKQLATSVAKSYHHPTIDLNGNYYLERSGDPRPSMWDIGVSLVFPIFSGGEVFAKVRDAKIKESQAIVNKNEAVLNITRSIEMLYSEYIGVKSELIFIEKSFERANASYQEHLKDNKFGLSTQLDVLQAETLKLTAQRKLVKSKYQLTLCYLQLMLAVDYMLITVEFSGTENS